MRKISSPVVVALLLALAPAARAETRIAVVDFQRAGNECDEGKAATAQLQKEKDDKLKTFKAKQADFDTMRADFDKQQSVLSDAVKQQKTADLQKKGEELQQTLMQLQQELAVREEEVTRGVADRLSAVVKEVADKEGIQVVLNKAVVVYSPESLDLTNEVIRKYNARFPAKAPPAAAAADPKVDPKAGKQPATPAKAPPKAATK
jgi:outer membrane protein